MEAPAECDMEAIGEEAMKICASMRAASCESRPMARSPLRFLNASSPLNKLRYKAPQPRRIRRR